jgi:hypothetical protein
MPITYQLQSLIPKEPSCQYGETGVPLRRSRLIVAISKADLQGTAMMSGRPTP